MPVSATDVPVGAFTPSTDHSPSPTTIKVSPRPLKMRRNFSRADVHPFDEISWERRPATITDEAGNVVFEQPQAEVPAFFSQLAVKVVVSKYFYGELGTAERETSFRQLVHRVSRTIADWGLKDGIFDS